ncbi:MAG TPA: extracellular solute-binding protein [Roseiarcus sp.]|nr:extracellular solute-binding protein [Roseiarcus sp.]
MTWRRASVFIFVALASLTSASALAQQSPFAPPPQTEPRYVKLLAFGDYFDAAALAEFEKASGRQVAYDAYDSPDEVAGKMRDEPYDLIVMPAPALPEAISSGALQKIDRARLSHFSAVSPRVMAKLASYDPGGAYALPYMWFVTGLLMDADKAKARLGAAPVSWGVLFSPELARRFGDCGLAAPDDRDNLFVAAWKFMGTNLARLAPVDIRRAGDLILRLKAAARAFLAPDSVGALANGSVCVSIGREADAGRAMERAKQGGLDLTIRFAVPKEGAPMSIDAFVIPKNAPHLDDSYALLDFLLRPDIAARNSRAAGAASGDEGGNDDLFKNLAPVAAMEPAQAALVSKEWLRVKAADNEASSGGASKGAAKATSARQPAHAEIKKREAKPPRALSH